jgi:hypothetical protein
MNNRTCLIVAFKVAGLGSMKFVIEIIRTDEALAEVLDRIEIDETSKKRAAAKANLLLSHWRDRGATSARILIRTEGA